MRVLIVGNETLGGTALLEAVRERAQKGATFVICVPRGQPRHGNVIYDDAVFDAAQVRVDLARRALRDEGIDAIGEVGDPDPYTAVMDAIAEHSPDEIILSTYPYATSGWMRRDLVERVQAASGLPVEHIVVDLENEGLPFAVTLVVANRTAASEPLAQALKAKASGERHLFIVIVPQEGGGGAAANAARGRLGQTVDRLRSAGLLVAGMVADPDPYTATMNALQFFRVDDIVVSTLDETRSGWLRADLIERLKRSAGRPVQHVAPDRAAAPAEVLGGAS